MLRTRSVTILQCILLITGLYIIWQISVSGVILTAQSVEQSDRLSKLARKTVDFGMALFVFRAGYRRLGVRPVIPLALILGWAAMWSENAIVNHFADKSSAQVRLEAKLIQLFMSSTLPSPPRTRGYSG